MYLIIFIFKGTKNRALGSHSMNEHSSRGHTLLTVYIEIESKTIGEPNEIDKWCPKNIGLVDTKY